MSSSCSMRASTSSKTGAANVDDPDMCCPFVRFLPSFC
jgi:hypothetical protein